MIPPDAPPEFDELPEVDAAPVELVAQRRRGRVVAVVRWWLRRALLRVLRLLLRFVHWRTWLRLLGAFFRGVGVILAGLVTVLSAGDIRDVRQQDAKYHHHVKTTRWKVAGVVTVLSGVVVFALWLRGQLDLLWWVALAGTVAAVLVGRRNPILAPAPALAGLAPPDVFIRQAFVDAKVGGARRELDEFELTRPVVQDGPDAWTTEILLPSGVTFLHAVRLRRSIASGLRVGQAQVVLTGVADDERLVDVWCTRTDPFKRKPTRNPLVANPQPTDLWDPQSMGTDGRDRAVRMMLIFAGLLLGSLPRVGKTVAALNYLVAAALDVRAQLWIADGKGLDARPFTRIAHEVCGRDSESLVAMLLRLQMEIGRRLRVLGELGKVKLDRETTHNHEGMGPIVLWIDELRRYLKDANPKMSAEVRRVLEDIVSIGPTVGVIPVLATQYPNAVTIPTNIRDLIPVRLALACTTWQMSDAILGGKAASTKGADASVLTKEDQGVSILVGAGAGPVQFRTHLIEPADVIKVVDYAYELRKRAGVLPLAAVPDGELHPLLAAVRGAFESLDGDRMASSELLGILADVNHLEWHGMTAQDLAAQLSTWELKPRQMGRRYHLGNVRGYMRSDVEQALSRVLTGR